MHQDLIKQSVFNRIAKFINVHFPAKRNSRKFRTKTCYFKFFGY